MNAPPSPSTRSKHSSSPTPRSRPQLAHAVGRELSPSPARSSTASNHPRRESTGERRSEQRNQQQKTRQRGGKDAEEAREGGSRDETGQQVRVTPAVENSALNGGHADTSRYKSNIPRSLRGKRAPRKDKERPEDSNRFLVDAESNPFLSDKDRQVAVAIGETSSTSSPALLSHSYPPSMSNLGAPSHPASPPHPLVYSPALSVPTNLNNVNPSPIPTSPDQHKGRLIESFIKQKLGIGQTPEFGIISPPQIPTPSLTKNEESNTTQPPTYTIPSVGPKNASRKDRPHSASVSGGARGKTKSFGQSDGASGVEGQRQKQPGGQQHLQQQQQQQHQEQELQQQQKQRRGRRTLSGTDGIIPASSQVATASNGPKTNYFLYSPGISNPTSPSYNAPIAPPSATVSTPAPGTSPGRYDHYYAGGAFVKSPSPAALPVPAFGKRPPPSLTSTPSVGSNNASGSGEGVGEPSSVQVASSYPPRPPRPPTFSGAKSRAESGARGVGSAEQQRRQHAPTGIAQRGSDWDVFAAGGGMEGVGTSSELLSGGGGGSEGSGPQEEFAEKSRRLMAMLGAGASGAGAGFGMAMSVKAL
ncbi:hypothetical protein HDU93_006147 [Gonapodya sp. JEL0774]|nr:hypothetical protein HDU93_006147 [Gonapodya sp. JEL0774]